MSGDLHSDKNLTWKRRRSRLPKDGELNLAPQNDDTASFYCGEQERTFVSQLFAEKLNVLRNGVHCRSLEVFRERQLLVSL